METINERFKQLRKLYKKNQQDWGAIIGITKNGVCDIESGRRKVTEKHIKMLCLNPVDGKYINEDYLRNGIGEPFLDLDRRDEILLWASEIMKGESKDYIERFSSALSKLSSDDWEVLANIAETLVKQKEPR